ncbi:hypothetical protein K7W42_18880 [Deinococcus sp. HMF7604]|uniref:hypothetical protein n=1 Tax=Deinococcus betulae TaxID=2873312 RepID=UPI001CCBA823|nr:hypothetical protein [Deinococcus betulae]MBZ9752908.1 hypothetical protein [Deinococcus betulae]
MLRPQAVFALLTTFSSAALGLVPKGIDESSYKLLLACTDSFTRNIRDGRLISTNCADPVVGVEREIPYYKSIGLDLDFSLHSSIEVSRKYGPIQISVTSKSGKTIVLHEEYMKGDNFPISYITEGTGNRLDLNKPEIQYILSCERSLLESGNLSFDVENPSMASSWDKLKKFKSCDDSGLSLKTIETNDDPKKPLTVKGMRSEIASLKKGDSAIFTINVLTSENTWISLYSGWWDAKELTRIVPTIKMGKLEL